MKPVLPICSVIAGLAMMSGTVEAPAAALSVDVTVDRSSELPAYLQCVPYARETSGIQIYGDARTWWEQADGRYARGRVPKVGAVMTFVPTEQMQLGHVATVARVIDRRTVLLDHANWSPIDGRRGQIERGVKAVDVSPANDWSEVRVWYAPLQDLGTTRWPVAGFIYNDGKAPPVQPVKRFAAADMQRPAESKPIPAIVRGGPSRDFSAAFAGLGQVASEPTSPRPTRVATAAKAPAVTRPPIVREAATAAKRDDPFAAVLAKYD